MLGLMAGLALAAQAAPPGRVEITYDLARNGDRVATIVDRLEHDGRAYRLTESWKGTGVYALRGEIRRSSRGSIVTDGLRPREFADERTGRDTVRAHFDWSANTLTLERSGKVHSRRMPERAGDRLTLLFGFSFAPPGGRSVSLSVADGRGVSEQTYDVSGRLRLKTPAGEFDTLRLIRRKDDAGDRGAEIWLAADRHYLPVRVLIVEKDGTRIDQLATRIATP